MTEPDVFRGVSNRKSRVRMWWCIVMLVTGVAAVGSVLFIGYGRSQGQRIQCVAHLFQLGYGMRVFQDKYGHLPPAHVDGSDGRRMHSWRILVTEHVTLPAPYPYDFNEAWDSEKNTVLGDYRPGRYACPSDSATQKNQRLTNYFVVTGSDTPFPGSKTTNLPVFIGPKGSSNTILVVEASDLNIEWLEPRDLVLHEMSLVPDDPKRPSISSHHPDGPLVMMADGSIRSIKGIAPEVLRAMLQHHADGNDD